MVGHLRFLTVWTELEWFDRPDQRNANRVGDVQLYGKGGGRDRADCDASFEHQCDRGGDGGRYHDWFVGEWAAGGGIQRGVGGDGRDDTLQLVCEFRFSA